MPIYNHLICSNLKEKAGVQLSVIEHMMCAGEHNCADSGSYNLPGKLCWG